MNSVRCVMMLGLAVARGTFAATKVDLVCLAVATLGLAAWLATDEPVVGLLLFLGAAACGAIPPLRHVFIAPAHEAPPGWAPRASAGAAAVISVEPHHCAWSWTAFG